MAFAAGWEAQSLTRTVKTDHRRTEASSAGRAMTQVASTCTWLFVRHRGILGVFLPALCEIWINAVMAAGNIQLGRKLINVGVGILESARV
jgi:hypothetical protein